MTQDTSKREKYGFILEQNEDGDIVAINCNFGMNSKLRLELGDTVVSNGRIFAEAGTEGEIVNFREPYTDRCTTNIIDVLWEGRSAPSSMKYKDLETSPCE